MCAKFFARQPSLLLADGNNLKKCLALEPTSPAQPTHSNVLNRIGNLQEKLGHPAEARAAYESALKLDPGNKQAAAALAALR